VTRCLDVKIYDAKMTGDVALRWASHGRVRNSPLAGARKGLPSFAEACGAKLGRHRHVPLGLRDP
jgi:hypothetical protein